jgi:inorganic pyrophosphatase
MDSRDAQLPFTVAALKECTRDSGQFPAHSLGFIFVIKLKRMAKKKALSSPTVLKPFDKQEEFLRVIIETPKGSRNKFKYDPDLGAYRLNTVLPEGMVFPYDFGFVPCTKAQDGDPVDVLLLMDIPAFPGIVVESRIVGVIEAEQSEDGKKTRNDRVVAVAKDSRVHSDIKKPADLNDNMLGEVERFFTNYNKERGKKFKVLGLKGAGTARKLIKESATKNGSK